MSFLPAEPSAVSVEVHSLGPGHPMRRMPPHGHMFFELILVTSGAGTIVVAGREIAVGPQTVVALPPGVQHDCRRIGTADGWSIIFLPQAADAHVETAFAIDDDVPDRLAFDPFRLSVLESPHPIELTDDAFEAALRLVECLRSELDARAAGYDVMARGALQMLLVTVCRCIAGTLVAAVPPSDRESHAFVAAVLGDIDRHFAHGGSLRAAARRLDVQPGHLTTKLRRLTGRTYGMWLIERRMIEARRLLTSTDLSLAVIAERLGYADIESFVRRFRTHHSVTPALWRRRARSGAGGEPAAGELRSIGA